jgi:hypothetical protein
MFWVETCCENLNKEKSKVLFVGVYFLQKTLNIITFIGYSLGV